MTPWANAANPVFDRAVRRVSKLSHDTPPSRLPPAACLVTLDQVIRGVMKRSGEPFEPEKISASAFKTIVEGTPPAIAV